MFPSLSQKVIDRIISFLSDDPPSLRHCALTCRALRPASQRALFHEIRIVSASGMDSFIQHVESHTQEVLDLVRGLTIVEDPTHPFGYLLPSQIVLRLARLESLTFVNLASNTSLHTPAFLTMLSAFTSVTKLSLFACKFDSFRDFSNLASALPHLSSLFVENVEWQGSPLRSTENRCILPPVPSRGPRLNTLVLSIDSDPQYFDAIVTWLLETPSAKSIARLRVHSFNFSIEGEELLILGRLLHSLGGSLTHLEMPFFDSSETILTFSDNVNLTSLYVNAGDIWFGGSAWLSVAGVMPGVASCIQSLEAEYSIEYPVNMQEEAKRHAGRAAVDIALNGENFRNLKRVDLRVSVFIRPYETDLEREEIRDALLQALRRGFTRLHSRGILFVEIKWTQSHV